MRMLLEVQSLQIESVDQRLHVVGGVYFDAPVSNALLVHVCETLRTIRVTDRVEKRAALCCVPPRSDPQKTQISDSFNKQQYWEAEWNYLVEEKQSTAALAACAELETLTKWQWLQN